MFNPDRKGENQRKKTKKQQLKQKQTKQDRKIKVAVERVREKSNKQMFVLQVEICIIHDKIKFNCVLVYCISLSLTLDNIAFSSHICKRND